MPIDRINIKNFKSIRDSGEVRIRPINVLIGSNGVGKTNFIQFFKLLNSIFKQRLKFFNAENGYENRILYFGRKQSNSIEGSIVFKPEKGNTNNRYDFKLVPQVQGVGFYFEKDLGGFNTYSKGYNENWDYITLGGEGKDESELRNNTSVRATFLCKYFEDFNVFHFHDTSSGSPLKQANQTRDYNLLKEDGSNLAAFLFKIKDTHPKHFKIIEHTIRSVAPFFERFDLNPDSINPDMIFLNWLENGSDDYFNAHNLSDGTLRFIALATLLLQPNLPKTIIIDEPELGLHPFAIQKLGALIKSASTKSQIIISTQSVNLVDQFSADDIIVVERQDNQTVFIRQSEDELGAWLANYSLGELWNKNILGGTTEMRGLYILGEGPTEEQFVNEVLRKYFYDRSIYDVRCILMETSRGHKGGAVSFQRLKYNVEQLLNNQKDIIVTSLIDFFRLHSDFPKYDEAKSKFPTDKMKRVAFLESQISESINSSRFVPYIQLHEFEGILFSSNDGFDFLPNIPQNNRKLLEDAVNMYENPELINDGPFSAPSKRLEELIPGYQKPLHGSLIAEIITVDKIIRRCDRFRNWIEILLSKMTES